MCFAISFRTFLHYFRTFILLLGGILHECGDFNLGVSDSEELVGGTHGR